MLRIVNTVINFRKVSGAYSKVVQHFSGLVMHIKFIVDPFAL